jgi:hypothetical protein
MKLSRIGGKANDEGVEVQVESASPMVEFCVAEEQFSVGECSAAHLFELLESSYSSLMSRSCTPLMNPP